MSITEITTDICLVSVTETRPDPLAVFELRAWARARLVEACLMNFYEAIDGLQEAAEHTGLVDEIGQDAVQAIMAAAFGARE
jgi:hypothetical protein